MLTTEIKDRNLVFPLTFTTSSISQMADMITIQNAKSVDNFVIKERVLQSDEKVYNSHHDIRGFHPHKQTNPIAISSNASIEGFDVSSLGISFDFRLFSERLQNVHSIEVKRAQRLPDPPIPRRRRRLFLSRMKSLSISSNFLLLESPRLILLNLLKSGSSLSITEVQNFWMMMKIFPRDFLACREIHREPVIRHQSTLLRSFL